MPKLNYSKGFFRITLVMAGLLEIIPIYLIVRKMEGWPQYSINYQVWAACDASKTPFCGIHTIYDSTPDPPPMSMFSWVFAEWISPELLEMLAIPIFMIAAYKVLMWVSFGFRVDRNV